MGVVLRRVEPASQALGQRESMAGQNYDEHSHAGVGLLLGEVAGQAQVGDAHVAVFIQEDVGWLWRSSDSGRPTINAARLGHEEGRSPAHLEVPVDHKAAVHVLQAQDDLGRVEAHVGLGEDAVLGQVVVEVPACRGSPPWGSAPGATPRAGPSSNPATTHHS